VTLTATPSVSSIFSGWGGDCSGIGACELTMDSAHVVTANFSAPGTTYSLTVNAGSNGSVTPSGTSTRNAGEVVSIIATPNSGYHFVNWTGNWGMIAHTTGASTTITMNGNYTITANFAANTSTSYSLTMRAGSGGTVTAPASSPSSHTSGTVVTLTASPNAGYHFVSWTGLINTVANPKSASTTVVMNGNYVIQANFAAGTTTLLGDVNSDSLVNSTDALIVLSGDVGISIAPYCPANCGDVNGDTFVNSTDALIILSYDVGMSVPFAVGEAGCPVSVNLCDGCMP
jgi:hypothetical protein